MSSSDHDRRLARENEELRSRNEQLSRLLDVARLMSFEKSLDALLPYIARQLTSAIGADTCSIFLVDEKTDELWSRIVLSQDSEIRFPRTKGIAGYTLRTGEALIINEPYDDPRFNPEVDEQTGYRTRNLITTPLSDLEGRFIGCFEVLNKQVGSFTRSDLDYLVAFASQAAVAIVGAQLLAEREAAIGELEIARDRLSRKMDQLEIVHELEKAVNDSPDFDAFMQQVLTRAAEAVSGTAGSILLRDSRSQRVYFSYRIGEASDRLRKLYLEHDEGIAGHVMATGKVVLDNEVEKNPRFSSRIADTLGVSTRTMIAVPLRLSAAPGSGDRRINGALEVINHRSGAFSEGDLAILMIIAEQVTSAIARKKLLEDRERHERLATIGTLTSTIIHDIKIPMGTIRGYGELIQIEDLALAKRLMFGKIIVGQVDRCVNMTQELLSFATGKKRFEFERTSIRQFLESTVLILDNEAAQQGIRIDLELEYDGPVRMDQGKMSRVVFNLFNNSKRFMEDGGAFSIRTTLRGDQLELRITDSGPGVPREIMEELFDPFVTSGPKGGTGLGLSIARDIIEGHGGTIHLDQTTRPGASFVILLPIGPAVL